MPLIELDPPRVLPRGTGSERAVEVRLRFGIEPPTVPRVVEELHEAHRNIDPHRIVGWAGFQQQDLRVRVLGEPVGHYATGRTSADDDVVVIGHSAPP